VNSLTILLFIVVPPLLAVLVLLVRGGRRVSDPDQEGDEHELGRGLALFGLERLLGWIGRVLGS
jgi:hypothetical protein